MDATTKDRGTQLYAGIEIGRGPQITRPSREKAEEAVRTLIAYAGDDPQREGLRDTPRRVTSAYDEFFAGYDEDPFEVLSRTFDEVAGYDDIVMLRDIELHSHCEHHMIPFIGRAHIAYFPTDRVVGLSKLARVVAVFARRLQTQKTTNAQIAETMETGEAHYWARSRKALWRKGETSGNVQRIVEMRTDCDQDVLWLKVEMTGTGACCHTGRVSCFYRSVPFGEKAGQKLVPVGAERKFDPEAVYGHSAAAKGTLKSS